MEQCICGESSQASDTLKDLDKWHLLLRGNTAGNAVDYIGYDQQSEMRRIEPKESLL